MTSIPLPILTATPSPPVHWHEALDQLSHDLKASTGLWICFKDLNTTLHTTSPIHLNQHHHPYCLAIKSDEHRLQSCIDNDDHIQHPDRLNHEEIWIRRCPFGVVEIIATLHHHEEAIGHLLIGSWREPSPSTVLSPKGLKRQLQQLPIFESDKALAATHLAINTLKAHLHLRDSQLNQLALDHDPLMQEALDYMQTHLNAGLRAPEVADHIGLSHSRFIHRFNESCGLGFGDWVRREILKHAVDRLTQTEQAIHQIADDLGFRSPNHLSSLFRQHYDMSPSEFRKQAKEPRV